MHEYHGWLRSNSVKPIGELRDNTPGNDHYLIFVGHVNGTIHVSFSGNSNRDRGELSDYGVKCQFLIIFGSHIFPILTIELKMTIIFRTQAMMPTLFDLPVAANR